MSQSYSSQQQTPSGQMEGQSTTEQRRPGILESLTGAFTGKQLQSGAESASLSQQQPSTLESESGKQSQQQPLTTGGGMREEQQLSGSGRSGERLPTTQGTQSTTPSTTTQGSTMQQPSQFQQQSSLSTTQGGAQGTGQRTAAQTVPSMVQEAAQATTPISAQVTQQAAIAGPSVSKYVAGGQLPFARTVLITGSSGSTGVALLRQLEKMESRNFNVIVGTHGISQSWQQELCGKFEKCVTLNADEPQSLDFRGVNELLIIPPNSEKRVAQVQNYVNAAKQCGVNFILLLSILGTEKSSAANFFTQQFRQMEDVVEQSGIPCCFLRSNLYMENLYLQDYCIARDNVIALPLREGHWAPVSVHDVAKCLAVMLAHPEPHLNKAYDLTGPELLTGQQIARCLSSCLNLPQLRYQSCSPKDFTNMLIEQDVPNWLANGLGQYFNMFETDAAYDSLDSKEFYRYLTGEQMTTLKEWVQQNINQLNNIINKAKQETAPQQQQQQLGRQQPQVGALGGGLGLQQPQAGLEEGGPMDKLKSLLHELISERSDFNLEERRIIDRNEDRLRRLHQLEKSMFGMGAAGVAGPTVGSGGMQPQQTQQQQSQLGQEQQLGTRRGGLVGEGLQEQGISGGRGLGTQQLQSSWEQPQRQQAEQQGIPQQQQQPLPPQRGLRESGMVGGRGGMGQYEGGLGGAQKVEPFGKSIGGATGGLGQTGVTQQQQQPFLGQQYQQQQQRPTYTAGF